MQFTNVLPNRREFCKEDWRWNWRGYFQAGKGPGAYITYYPNEYERNGIAFIGEFSWRSLVRPTFNFVYMKLNTQTSY